MRALGNRSWHAVRLIMLECALLGTAGATLGVVAGILLAALISAIGIPMPPPPNSSAGYTATIAVVPAVVLQAFLVGVLATVLAGPVPALRARRVAIVDALQRGM
jgi:putative ABC transport system permease protein